jgi:glycosyltransferase involved in cell wall biosynthesis
MKIAFVSTILHYPWGGADALWTSAAETAIGRGDTVFVAVSGRVARHDRVRALQARGAAILLRPEPEAPPPLWQRAWRRSPWSERHPLRLRNAIGNFRPDFVVFSCGGTYDPILEPALVAWLQASGTPYRIIANFQEEHPVMSEEGRQAARAALTGAARIYCVSPRNLELTRLQLLDPLPNAETIHGCMGINPIDAGSAPAWPDPPPWSFACIARLEPVKGLDLLIHALAASLREFPEWRLNIYGRGPQREYLQACAHYAGLGERIHFPGFVERLDDIWAQNHLLLSPAVDEGMPVTLPEAMLRDRAVLATRVGAATEWIIPGETGFICAAPTVELLAESLREAWAQRERWREMGAAAGRRTRALYRPNDYERIVAPSPHAA